MYTCVYVVCCYQPPSDGQAVRPIRRTASELPTGQNIRRPDLADHAATRLAQLSNIGGGATVRLSTVADDDDEDEEMPAADVKRVVDTKPARHQWAGIDSDRSFVGNGKQFQDTELCVLRTINVRVHTMYL